VRWPIACILIAISVIGAGLLSDWWLTRTTSDTQEWRVRRVSVLKDAYDRVQADLDRQPQGPVLESLLRSQRAISDAIAETTRGLPPDLLPETVQRLLIRPETPVEHARDAVVVGDAIPGRAELAVGLTAPPATMLDISGLSIDPELHKPLPPSSVRGKPIVKRPDEDKVATTKKSDQDQKIQPSDLDKLIEAIQSEHGGE
jgi:hypothetical protein